MYCRHNNQQFLYVLINQNRNHISWLKQYTAMLMQTTIAQEPDTHLFNLIHVESSKVAYALMSGKCPRRTIGWEIWDELLIELMSRTARPIAGWAERPRAIGPTQPGCRQRPANTATIASRTLAPNANAVQLIILQHRRRASIRIVVSSCTLVDP